MKVVQAFVPFPGTRSPKKDYSENLATKGLPPKDGLELETKRSKEGGNIKWQL